jgi:hypothetical protein
MDGDITKRMGENSIGRALTMAEGQMRINSLADSDITYKAGCGAGRAYIGLGDDGSIGDGVEGSEGTDGRLPLYKKIGEHTTE